MSFWKRLQDNSVQLRLDDEAYHALALREIQEGRRRDGLWAKALAKTGGNESALKAEYLRLLVVALRDQDYLARRNSEFISGAAQHTSRITSTHSDNRDSEKPGLFRRFFFGLLFVTSTTIMAFSFVSVLANDVQHLTIWHWILLAGWLWLLFRIARYSFRAAKKRAA